MAFRGSLMLQKGMDKRKEEELLKCKLEVKIIKINL